MQLIHKPDIGLIAHELQLHFPQLVTGERDGTNIQTINYIGLIPILIREIQQLKKDNIELKKDNIELKKDTQLIKAKLNI